VGLVGAKKRAPRVADPRASTAALLGVSGAEGPAAGPASGPREKIDPSDGADGPGDRVPSSKGMGPPPSAAAAAAADVVPDVAVPALQDEVLIAQPRPAMDIFKAIFSDSEDDDSDQKEPTEAEPARPAAATSTVPNTPQPVKAAEQKGPAAASEPRRAVVGPAALPPPEHLASLAAASTTSTACEAPSAVTSVPASTTAASGLAPPAPLSEGSAPKPKTAEKLTLQRTSVPTAPSRPVPQVIDTRAVNVLCSAVFIAHASSLIS
jgi:hypothetical protein